MAMKRIARRACALLLALGFAGAPVAAVAAGGGAMASAQSDSMLTHHENFKALAALSAMAIRSVAKGIVSHISTSNPTFGVHEENYQSSTKDCGLPHQGSNDFQVAAPVSPLVRAVCAVVQYTVDSQGNIKAKIFIWGIPAPHSNALVKAGLKPGTGSMVRIDTAIATDLIQRYSLLSASTGLLAPRGGLVNYLASSNGPYSSGAVKPAPPIPNATMAPSLAPIAYLQWQGGSNGGQGGSKPTVSISANPSNVSYGGSSTISWSSTNATSCSLNGSSVSTSGSQGTGGLKSSRTYTLSCSGYTGSASGSVTVSVAAPAKPTVSVSASPNPDPYNGYTVVSWSSTHANSCSFGGKTVATSGSQREGRLKSSQTYTVSCTGAGGSASGSVTVTVHTPKPTVHLSAMQNPLAYGATTSLIWYSSYATSCSLSGFGSVGPSGSRSVGPLTSSASYTISCSGRGGTASASVTISVKAPPGPIVYFSASPTSLSAPGNVLLKWHTRNATSCNLSGVGRVPVGGNFLHPNAKTVKVNSTTTFTLTCTGAGGTTRRRVTITVKAQPPTVSISANPTSVAYGGSSTISWSSKNASSCTLNGTSVATSGSKGTGRLYSNKGYTLSCSGAGGSASGSVTVRVGAHPPQIMWFTVGTNPVAYGGTTSLHWGSKYDSYCTLNGARVGTYGPKTVGPLHSTTTYTLTCYGAGGHASARRTVTVSPPPPPKIRWFSASPNPAKFNTKTTLYWATYNASYCKLNGTRVGSGGPKTVGPIRSNTYYRLVCYGPGGSASASLTVRVTGVPPYPTINTFTAKPGFISSGSGTKLSWTTSNASSCSINGVGVGVNGSRYFYPKTKTTYTLKCSNARGSASASRTVRVIRACQWIRGRRVCR